MEQKIEHSKREELYLKYVLPEQGFIYRNCYRYSSSKEETQNYYSEVIERVFMYIETYNPQHHIRPWLSVIIQHVIYKIKKTGGCTTSCRTISDRQSGQTWFHQWKMPWHWSIWGFLFRWYCPIHPKNGHGKTQSSIDAASWL